MLLLTNTTHTLELISSSTSALNYTISWADITTTDFTPGSTDGAITTATTTTVLAAPAASTQRQVKFISVANKGASTQTITLQKDVSGTNYVILPSVSLLADQTLQYIDGEGFTIRNASGIAIVSNATPSAPLSKLNPLVKSATANEAASVRYSYYKDLTLPGVFAPGTPGVSGRVTSGTAAADAGCIPIWTPSSGSLYMTGNNYGAGFTQGVIVTSDWLWINTGLVVTTTTAQSVASVTLPARDLDGSTNGKGVYAAILVTTATTNAGAITNMTLDYTNSAGTTTRTGTITSFPATAVAGTIVAFELQAGDEGIRTIDNITLGTSLVTGAISLILFRTIAITSCNSINIGAINQTIMPPSSGIKLYNDSCLIMSNLLGISAAAAFSGTTTITQK